MKINKIVGIMFLLMGIICFGGAAWLWTGAIKDEQMANEAIAKVADNWVIERNEQESSEETVIPDYILNPEMDMPTEKIDGKEYIGKLQVPSLELDLPIMARWSYDNLAIAPNRFAGSAYLNNMILMAHNYDRHFGRLKTLQPGDAIEFVDVDGNVFKYEVREVLTIQPTAVEEMKTGDWDLTLFTCTKGGAARVTIRCDRVED